MTFSVRRRLLFVLLTATGIVWTVTALVSYYDARREINELFDAQLAQSAQVLMSLVEHEAKEELQKAIVQDTQKGLITRLNDHLTGHRYEKNIAFQISIGHGRFVFHSPQAPATPLSSVDSGFSDEKIGDYRWRVISLSEQGGLIRVSVGERFEVRRDLLHRITERLLAPLIVVLPVLALIIWLSVGRLFAPFAQLADDVGTRDPASLQPINDAVPAEAKPLVTALNGLFARLRQALEREKRLTADTAHELRTPLAGFRMQAEVAKRSVNDGERQNALNQLIKGVDRTTHLVEQLLTMARLEPEIGSTGLQSVYLTEIVSGVLAELNASAIDKGIDIDFRHDETIIICADADSVRILVRNLIDNAIRYTPHGGHVTISVSSVQDQTEFTVSDSGPGIEPQEQDRVFERFRRGRDSPAAGSGLGLSIVRRIADLHGASVTLGTSAYGGLEVRVMFQL